VTERRTDRIAISISRVSVLTRDKNKGDGSRKELKYSLKANDRSNIHDEEQRTKGYQISSYERNMNNH